jgi:hypothetical protein
MEFRILNSKALFLFQLFLVSMLIFSCTKEVKIDIPGYEEQLVVDGYIEPGSFPIVLISRTNDIYASTDLNAYLNGFVNGAIVSINDGTKTYQLEEICTDNLTGANLDIAAAIFGIPAEELANYNLCAYTTLTNPLIGEVGKTYNLTVSYEGKTYTSSTTLLPPTPLLDLYWKEAANKPGLGWTYAKLADPAGQYDAYRWEVKYKQDIAFTKTFNPFFDDTFFDGLTFEFPYENPMNRNDESVPEEIRGYYKKGDTVIVKLSKLGKESFNFFEKKYAQLSSGGNPFATPTNIPTNIKGGALGVWVGFSPFYDTLICKP